MITGTRLQYMAETGYFENGRWIEGEKPSDIKEEKPLQEEKKANNESQSEDTGDIDRIISETTESVKNAVESVINFGNTVIGTEKGRKDISKKAKKSGKALLKSIEDAIEEAKKSF